MKPSISLLYVTFPDEESAEDIGRKLLAEKHIACINFFPIRSLYTWEGKIEDGKEIVAFIKTRTECSEKTIRRIKELHPYKTPCILHKTLEANDEYYKWVQAVTIT